MTETLDLSETAGCLARVFALCVLAFAGWASAARAELIIFSDGRVVKAASHREAGSSFEIGLLGGGSYTVDPKLIERVVADEVAGSNAPPPPAVQAPAPAPVKRPAPVIQPAPINFPPPLPVNSDDASRGKGRGQGKRGKRGL